MVYTWGERRTQTFFLTHRNDHLRFMNNKRIPRSEQMHRGNIIAKTMTFFLSGRYAFPAKDPTE